MIFFITLLLILTMAIIAWSSIGKWGEELERLPTMPLSEIRKKLGITEHVTTVIVSGKPIHFDSGGKEIK